MKQLRLTFVLALALAAACGTEEPPPAADGGPIGTGPYLPLAEGATWTYNVFTPGQGAAVQKMSTVMAPEDVGGIKAGVTAFRVLTEKTDGTTISWQAVSADGVIRHREQEFDLAMVQLNDQFYQPAKLRIDETAAHITVGATWSDSYTEIEIDPMTMAMTTTPKSETWTVESVDDTITVPAGTFTCLRLHRAGSDTTQAVKRFWFARGVGKIREESLSGAGGQIEELVSYDLPAP